MTKFAAHDDLSIYAVADTAEAAITKARDEARDLEAQFLTAQISDELAAQIERDGWDGMRQSFDVVNGWIKAD
jgi:N-acetylglutamate synthase/N-acetylornithine aminotransferase